MSTSQIRYNAYSSWACDLVATLAAGSTFVPLNDQPCDVVTIILNSSGSVKLDIINSCQTDLTKFISIDAPSGFVLPVGGNANEISIRRTDLSATPVTVRYVWGKYRR